MAKSIHLLIWLGCSVAEASTVCHFVPSLHSASGPMGPSQRLLRAARRLAGFVKFLPLALLQQLGEWRISWLFKYSNSTSQGELSSPCPYEDAGWPFLEVVREWPSCICGLNNCE